MTDVNASREGHVDPPWLREGEMVAVSRPSRRRDVVAVTSVERITERHVVLADGNRFPRATLRKWNPCGSYVVESMADSWRRYVQKESAEMLRIWRRTGDPMDAQYAIRLIQQALAADEEEAAALTDEETGQ
jgi:hypothetical protein